MDIWGDFHTVEEITMECPSAMVWVTSGKIIVAALVFQMAGEGVDEVVYGGGFDTKIDKWTVEEMTGSFRQFAYDGGAIFGFKVGREDFSRMKIRFAAE